ncbi:MBOAT family O-acyltransferase [Oscillatoria acuminata]|uniref:Putative membrane protein involved in D-alanine export n=1 Tax=Oscillatoria acuminata PCC 6304 TaxID=56110 RepID=K9TQF5_9CYAN|nr:MBOAT family protein [Oscillatoria acuminata]AFY85092.1 putative membrane protein involved in D-alanine export [Oscillatoria acuminata PCC 6304]
MLFNSLEFIGVFLPLTLLLFYQIGKRGYYRWALASLVAASLFFYAWWNPPYLLLLIFSIGLNYTIGWALIQDQKLFFNQNKKTILIIGLAANLAIIGYYKYFGFFIENLKFITPVEWHQSFDLLLPLGISFFTFQQIAYLVDCYRVKVTQHSLLKYVLFVSFFPQLIAGPIVHHEDLIPQFYNQLIYKFSSKNFALGCTIFIIGLFKKVVFADNIAKYANPIFNAAAQGTRIQFFEAWGGAIAYSLQLYYDFSGYSDMAIGAALLFGITLPLNFYSPYQATSIIEFWRRWHITLSNFLRDYLYIPLGGNRHGEFRRQINLMITMLLGGLWHGAGWTFVLWGGLHGIYLVINSQWRAICKKWRGDRQSHSGWSRVIGGGITLIAVIVAWVFFRANNLDTALLLLQGMMGGNGVSIPLAIVNKLGFIKAGLASLGMTFKSFGGEEFIWTYIWGLTLLIIALLCPNTYQLMKGHNPPPAKELIFSKNSEISPLKSLTWQPNCMFAIFMGIATFVLFKTFLGGPESEFLYFNF